MSRFKRPCKAQGCGNLTTETYCEEHKYMRKGEDQRLNSNARGYNYKWQKYSRTFLKMFPLCAQCLREGRHTPATVVDHVIAHKGDQELFWDMENHESLCETCHNRKTAKYDMGSWKK